MSVVPVGKQRLGAVLDETQRIIVSNRTSLEGAMSINAIALGLHDADGNVRFRTVSGAPVAAGESLVVDDDRPIEDKIVAVEAFVRLTGDAPGRILDAYVKLEVEDSAASLGDIELGVADAGDESLDEAAVAAIDEAPDFALFARGQSS